MTIFETFHFSTQPIYTLILLSFSLPILLFILLSLFLYFFNALNKFLSNDIMTSLSAGLLMSLTFIVYLPHSLQITSHFVFSITLLLSIVFLLLIETHLIPKFHFSNYFTSLTNQKNSCHHFHQQHYHPFSESGSFSTLGCLIICAFFDGIRIASGFLIGSATMGATVLASFLHILPEGMVVLALSKQSNLSQKSCFMIQSFFCLALFLGILSVSLINLKIDTGIILSFSTGTLMYVTFIHLLPVSFKKKTQVWFLLSLFVTSLVIGIIHI